MAQFEPRKNDFDQAGVDVIYIAAEKQDGFHKPSKFLEANPVSFPFLLDEDRTVTRAYGLYHRIGIDAFNIAHPATLLVDRVGSIRYIYVGGNQFDRAPIEQVLTLARTLPH